MQGEDTTPGGTDKVVKVQGDAAVDVDTTTAVVIHWPSKWREEVETQEPLVHF